MDLLFASNLRVETRRSVQLRNDSYTPIQRLAVRRPNVRRVTCTAEYDVVVIGGGLGGLSAAAVLSAAYGLSVCVCEAHTIAGGAAHSFKRRTSRGEFTFDSGPSLFSGIAGATSSNPLQHVLRASGAKVEMERYDAWGCYFEQNAPVDAPLSRGEPLFATLMNASGGENSRAEVARLVEAIRPLARAVTSIPSAALRVGDTAGTLRCALRYARPSMLLDLPVYGSLSQPFGPILRKHISDPFAYNFMDLLCFLLAGVGANDILTAEVAFMFSEWTGASAGDAEDNRVLEFPIGGSGAIVDALVHAIEQSDTGSCVRLGAPVKRVLVKSGAATGVELSGGECITARKCVMSNASVWDTARLVDSPAFERRVESVTQLPSFVHLHVALDMRDSGVNASDLNVNSIFVESWARGIEAPQNVVALCIPSALDPALAPEGHIVMHAYVPATEPYELYKGLVRTSDEYRELKKRRCDVLWRAIERVVPDARERAHIVMEGTPLTHERFLRVDRGTYGPLVSAKKGLFPVPMPSISGIDRLLCIGQSTFPGIGVPAVAASGFGAANSLVPVEQQLQLLDRIGL